MSAYYNANSSGYTSELRQQNVVDTIRDFKSSCAEERKSVVKAPVRERMFKNESSHLDTKDLFSGLKFSESRYASSKCRLEKAKSYFRSAKKYFKQKDYIAMLHYMRCSMCNACSALLDLVQEEEEQYMNVMYRFESCYIETGLFNKHNFVFLIKIAVLTEKIVRGDFFIMPKERFNTDLTRVAIFLEDSEEILSNYYTCADREIENSKGGNDHERI